MKSTVIIPNYNGIKFIENCMQLFVYRLYRESVLNFIALATSADFSASFFQQDLHIVT